MHKLVLPTALTLAAALTSGCAVISDRPGQPNAAAAVQAPHYVLLRAEQTDLVNVANDKGNMILEFGTPVSTNMQLFDNDGNPLNAVSEGTLAWLPGLSKGVLIRVGEAVSFVSVRAGADVTRGPQMADSPQLQALRHRVSVLGPAKKAMMRALAAVGTTLPAVSNKPKITIKNLPETSAAQQAAPAPEKPALPNWRSVKAGGLPPSRINPQGTNGYLTFDGEGVLPLQATQVVDPIVAMAKKRSGVLLISGITGPNASIQLLELTAKRTKLLSEILIDEGVDPDKLTISAIYQSDTHVRLDPARPVQTVGLTWLADQPVAAEANKTLSQRN